MTARLRHKQGSSIVEGAVALTILIPLLIMIVYVILEASHAYLIYSSLQQGAQEGARLLATYPVGQPPSYTSYPLSQSQINDTLKQVQIPNVINDPAQFIWAPSASVPAGSPVFIGPASAPTSVVVTVKYTPGQYNLPPFPDADVLKLGSTFTLQASACYQVN
jgi:Flp pilus assembly protein TadG